MKQKTSGLIEEVIIWLRGRFTLTSEEKNWILLILFILWVGLIARYFHLADRSPQPLPPVQTDEQPAP